MVLGCLQENTHPRELEALPSLREGFIHAEPRREGQTGRLQQDCVRALDGDTVLLKKGREAKKDSQSLAFRNSVQFDSKAFY